MKSKQTKYRVAGATFALSVCLGLSGTSILNGGPAVAAGLPVVEAIPNLPPVILSRDTNGESAIQALGSRLTDVARKAGMTADELKALLRFDPSLWVNRWGDLNYVDPVRNQNEQQGTSQPAGDVSDQAPLQPLENTFLLHSKPGSNRVIYLDFNGHSQPAGTSWNNGVGFESLAYDTNGNRAVFDDTERAYVQRVWQGVSEMYSPFDVDVTTQEPPADDITRNDAADLRYGTRAVIADPTSHPVAACNCGGIAGVGVFDEIPASEHQRRQPAWIFASPPNASIGFPGPSSGFIASTISHEVGHNLSLRHDGHTQDGAYYSGHGSGVTKWAPIMGSGAGIEHWSKGEYPGYTNPFQTNADDYVAMTENGVSVRPDDFPNSGANAVELAGTPGTGLFTVNQSGVIETESDVDVFMFQAGAGPLSLEISPSEFNAMLDVRIALYDQGGNQIAKINDDGKAGTAKAVLVKTLTAGTYRLEIEGIGVEPVTGTGVRNQTTFAIDTVGFTDYGSIGQYRVSGTYTDSESANPIAVAGANKTSGDAPLTVAFTAQGSQDPDGTIVTYAWNFGDNTSVANNFAPSHTYTSKGSYTATLTVTDNAGFTGTASVVIAVSGVNPFAFADVTNARWNDQLQSNVITVSGITAPALISVSGPGATYRIGNGAFTSAVGMVSNGAVVRVRHTTANSGSTAVNTILTIGGVSDTFTSTTSPTNLVTGLIDPQPNQFTFVDKTGVAKNTTKTTSAVVILSGFTPTASISVSAGSQYCIGTAAVCGPNALGWKSTAGTLTSAAPRVSVRHTSSATGNTSTHTTLTVGGVTDTFTSTTGP
ncbi:MAG: PKD domain-containing protein [Panacagrimonas sp.]